MRIIVVLLTIVLLPIDAAAQEGISRSFEQLNRDRRLEAGATVWVFSDLEGKGEYEELKGRFVSLSETTIGFSVDFVPAGTAGLDISRVGGRYVIALPEDRVRWIDTKVGDPLGNGAMYGAVIGFCVVGLPALAQARDCPGQGVLAQLCVDDGMALVIGAVGAGVGAGIGVVADAAVKGRGTVYMEPAGTWRPIVSVSPIATRGRKGIVFMIQW